MAKHNLTHEQRQALYEWSSELLQLPEINQRAALFDPPFQVRYVQLKWARRVCGVQFYRDRRKADAEAVARGAARR